MSTAIALRDYQLAALDAVETAAKNGIKRPLLALPTGCGKTIIFAELIRRRGGRALILVHRDELVRQAIEKLHLVTSDARVGVVKAERDEHDADVVVASVQTLSRQARLLRLRPDFTTVVVDEAHHAVADSYRRVLAHLGCFTSPGPLTLGVTATPERGDQIGLASVFERIVYQRDILDMIRAGYLCELRAIQVQLRADFRQLHTRGGDFMADEAEELLLNADAPRNVVMSYLAHAAGRRALVFTPTVKVAHAMAETFRLVGIPAEALDGDTPTGERRGIIERLKAGTTKVVANCAVLTEGFDEPQIDCVVIARPTKSKVLYTQMIGRGTRRHPAKDDCLVLDVVGAARRNDLMTTASLFGLPEQGTVSKRGVAAAHHERQEAEAIAGRLEAQRVELFRQQAEQFQQRPMRWVTVDAGYFLLSLGTAGQVLLTGSGNDWRVIVEDGDGGRRVIAHGLSMEYAQGVAEDYVRRECPTATKLVDPSARWRQDEATEAQVRFAKRLGIVFKPGTTKGEAQVLIAAAKARRGMK